MPVVMSGQTLTASPVKSPSPPRGGLSKLFKRSPPQQKKRVILIRHGQAEHNVDRANLGKRDVQLTERGRMQAAAIRARVKKLGAEVVLTSPVLRTLQTTALLEPNGACLPNN